MKEDEDIGRRITAKGEPERSGHVAGDLFELRRGGARDGDGNATSPVLEKGKGVDVEVEDIEEELWADWLGRRSDGTAERARRGNGGAKWSALSESRSRLRHPLGAWRLVDAVEADRGGRRQRTADRWPDTRRQVNSVQTETFSESADCNV